MYVGKVKIQFVKCFQNLWRTKTFSNFPSVITKRNEIISIQLHFLYIQCCQLYPFFRENANKLATLSFWKFTWVLRLLHFSIQNDVTNTSRGSQWSRRQEWEPWSEIRFFGHFSNDSNRAICKTLVRKELLVQDSLTKAVGEIIIIFDSKWKNKHSARKQEFYSHLKNFVKSM